MAFEPAGMPALILALSLVGSLEKPSCKRRPSLTMPWLLPGALCLEVILSYVSLRAGKDKAVDCV